MIEILEHIARNGGDTARIQAIKALRGLVDVAEDAPEDDWSEIYGNVTPIGRKQAG